MKKARKDVSMVLVGEIPTQARIDDEKIVLGGTVGTGGRARC